jgi:hypothetical protein
MTVSRFYEPSPDGPIDEAELAYIAEMESCFCDEDSYPPSPEEVVARERRARRSFRVPRSNRPPLYGAPTKRQKPIRCVRPAKATRQRNRRILRPRAPRQQSHRHTTSIGRSNDPDPDPAPRHGKSVSVSNRRRPAPGKARPIRSHEAGDVCEQRCEYLERAKGHPLGKRRIDDSYQVDTWRKHIAVRRQDGTCRSDELPMQREGGRK